MRRVEFEKIANLLERIMTPILRIILIVFALAFAGCATPTKPNIPYSGPTPELDRIAQRNPLLAGEIRKLPELQDGVSVEERYTLEKVVEIYHRFPDKFNKAFEQMYQAGKPDVRKYCSPLQAIFWLMEDGNLNNSNNLINDYSLKKLLDNAWVIPARHNEPLYMTEEQITEIIGTVKNELIRKSYTKMLENEELQRLQTLILSNYDNDKRFFARKGRRTIKELLKDNTKNRWNDFQIVADRINSPELFNFWVNQYIKYGDFKMTHTKFAEETFRDRKGDCSDVAELGQTILNRAGYKLKKVCTPVHVMGYIEKDGLYWVIIDFSIDYTTFGNRPHDRPYKSLYEIGNIIPECSPRVEPGVR